MRSYFGKIAFILTPSRHFSGRTLFDRMQTLWGSWTISSGDRKIFFSGDSGYLEEFEKIGEKYGPFDIAFMECGAYNKGWAEVHMFPEQAVKAAKDINAKSLLPIHNGKFNLSLHPWTEPLERVWKAGDKNDMKIVTPYIGQTFSINGNLPHKKWWREV